MKRGKCVLCGKTSSNRWCQCPENLYHRRLSAPGEISETALNKNQSCGCHRKASTTPPEQEGPFVRRSTIRGAGNGLFADRDYKWGETIALYKGKIYADRTEVPKSDYVLQRGGFWIDGRVHFGNTGLGRYINAVRAPQKPNVYFGRMTVGHTVPVKVFTRSEAKKRKLCSASRLRSDYAVLKGEEFLVSYGNGYWRRRNRLREKAIEFAKYQWYIQQQRKRRRSTILFFR